MDNEPTKTGSAFDSDFTEIAGLSGKRRFPREGKIRLGKKVETKSGSERPFETSYFVCPDKVKAVYGEEPKELDIMFPNESVGACFPQAYKWYGRSKGLRCKGNGVNAKERDEATQEWKEKSCPCDRLKAKKDENGKVTKRAECSRQANLMFMLPKISVGGVYQVDIGSYNSIVDINSGLAFIREILGRISLVPLVLKRIARETHAEGQKQTHYTLHVHYQGNLKELAQLKRDSAHTLDIASKNLLPTPEEVNPEFDVDGEVIKLKDEENEGKPVEEKVAETKSEPKQAIEQKREPAKPAEPISDERAHYLKILPDIVQTIGEEKYAEIVKVYEMPAEQLNTSQLFFFVKNCILEAKDQKKAGWTRWAWKPDSEENIPF